MYKPEASAPFSSKKGIGLVFNRVEWASSVDTKSSGESEDPRCSNVSAQMSLSLTSKSCSFPIRTLIGIAHLPRMSVQSSLKLH